MDFKTLHEKYRQLLLENNRLKEEIKRMKTQPDLESARKQTSEGFTLSETLTNHTLTTKHHANSEPELFDYQSVTKHLSSAESMNKKSDPDEKVKLFMSLFKGRDDVYAKRWENKAKGTAGYSPACGNEWKQGICQKAKILQQNPRTSFLIKAIFYRYIPMTSSMRPGTY